MLINAKAVSFLLALCVSVITFMFLTLLKQASGVVLLVAAGISFSSAFILSYIVLEFLIFKEIQKIYNSLDKVTRKELRDLNIGENEDVQNPLKQINQQILAYVSKKEREIDELKKIEAYRKEFIADVSHELKTPIFAAQGYVLTLLDGAMDDEKVRHRFLKKAAKSLNGLDALVQDLLTLSQIESGVISMHYELFDLQSLVIDVFEQLERKAEKKSVELKLEKAFDDGIYVNADYTRITQVLINLISNAIKYGNYNGWVEVGLSETKKKIKVEIKDNGPGIAREHIDRIFERFYRVDKSRSKKQGGTGLGLAIVKHIIEGHNSKISLVSEINEGTTFTFYLPSGE
jgi:two-component system phosphate regulon sensor histidine kinase PhoR